jgi:hypothetical protein
LLCKKIIVVKSKEVKAGCNLAESCTEGYGSKRAVFLMMMIAERILYMHDGAPAYFGRTVPDVLNNACHE